LAVVAVVLGFVAAVLEGDISRILVRQLIRDGSYSSVSGGASDARATNNAHFTYAAFWFVAVRRG
jgi:hypothetical protein